MSTPSPADKSRSRQVTAPRGPRRLFEQVGGATTTLAEHRQRFAPPVVASRADHTIINAVEASGLRGRGGAGFPTATKMRAVVGASSLRRSPVVVVNGTEGEPISWKDATLLELQPHLVIDGALNAAMAVGAREIRVCIERGNDRAAEAVHFALRERERVERSGAMVTVHRTPPRYVAGEESALVHWLNGGEAKPTKVPPRPFQKGVDGNPTLVNNVETFAHLAQIVQYGPEWFRRFGTESEPGTSLMTLTGVDRPAVYETPIDARLDDLLRLAGTSNGVSAVLLGGYFGTWITADEAKDARLSNASLRPIGAALGCGVVAVLPTVSCGVVETTRVMRWMANETANQCGPCVNGLLAIAESTTAIANGRGGDDEVARLQRWAAMIDGRGACRFPDGAIRFLRSALRVFEHDFQLHAKGIACAATRAPRTLPIPRIHEGWR